ncbi:hypothetical protein KC867_01840 [Candidatus Saccharibacteria bacterium]|nr:hypothetical protein [Candidatus Saccharibacteria bacterium]
MIITKIKHLITIKKVLALSALIGLIVLNINYTNANAQGASVTQGYKAESVLQRGMIIGTKEDDATTVEPLNVEQMDRIMGVVVNANESPITISGEDEQVFVSTVGRLDVLVSNQNGTINPGDYVTLSSIAGIGMLATYNESQVLGQAVDGFDGENSVISKSSLADNIGSKREVVIGRIKVNVAISKNPIAKSAAVTPEWLGKIGQAIAGESLSPARLYLGAGLFLIGASISAMILYSGVRSSIISVGRNPLSKKSILRAMLQVIFTSLIVFIISVFGVYLLLKI